MSAVFADTFFFLAILNPSDPAHARASDLSRRLRQPRVTTAWVLTEVGDAFARDNRAAFLDLMRLVRESRSFASLSHHPSCSPQASRFMQTAPIRTGR